MSSSSMTPAERRWKPLAAPQCPRCGSPNTKFCYYNNYSLSQPRYFCKTCRRYWTMGGSLRNVPVGGGCRKNRRSAPKPAPATRPSSPTAPAPPAFASGHDVRLQPHDSPAAAAAAPQIDLAALFAKFSNRCAPPPPPPPLQPPPPPPQFWPGFAVAEPDANSGGHCQFGERPNGGEDFLGQQLLQHCYSVDGELELPADPSGVFGHVSLGAPSPLEFIDGFPSSDLDLSVPDLVNEDGIYKLALESAPVEGIAFDHHHDLYHYW